MLNLKSSTHLRNSTKAHHGPEKSRKLIRRHPGPSRFNTSICNATQDQLQASNNGDVEPRGISVLDLGELTDALLGVTGTIFKFKLMRGTANPCITLCAILVGGIDGLENKLQETAGEKLQICRQRNRGGFR